MQERPRYANVMYPKVLVAEDDDEAEDHHGAAHPAHVARGRIVRQQRLQQLKKSPVRIFAPQKEETLEKKAGGEKSKERKREASERPATAPFGLQEEGGEASVEWHR